LGISPDPAYFKLKPNAVVLTLGLQIDQPE
jgi:hypothetical protein